MTDLNEALVAIRSIRRQVAQSTEFHGYGPLTLCATAFVALLAGEVQSYWIPDAGAHPREYVALWLTTGFFCAALIATQMLSRAYRLHSGMADEMIRVAITQFLPAAITGIILPMVLLRVATSVTWLVPALWQIIFGLGVFASCRCLSRFMVLAGFWFLLTGLICLSLGDDRSLRPATMAYPYFVGMLLVAAIHYCSAKQAFEHEDRDR